MRKFWKTVGQMAALTLATKIIVEILRNCRKCRDCRDLEPVIDNTDAKFIRTQLVIWKRPGISDQEFTAWKNYNLPLGVLPVKLCENCDDSLELWEGDNVTTFISGKVASEGASAGGGGLTGGGDDVACFSYNLIIDLPEPEMCVQENRKQDSSIPPQPASDEPPIIIAVFDTGLDPQIKNAYTRPVFSCMPGGSLGWNFANKNNDTTDDHPGRHGTVVTKFIIDQALKYNKHPINILPVKVHNSLGKSDLFSILCGFAYAANCGAKIINASFGFYSSGNGKPPLILAEFVKKHLTDRNIILVAAAGNVNADKSFVPPAQLEKIRDLNLNPFFPACLASTYGNVMAVTTVSLSKDTVSPSQNFSNRIVSIGVRGDLEYAGDYRFRDSLNRVNDSGDPIFVLGSSFATPIVTGMLAQFYTEVISSMVNGSIDTDHVIQVLRLHVPGLIEPGADPLDDFILDGNYYEK